MSEFSHLVSNSIACYKPNPKVGLQWCNIYSLEYSDSLCKILDYVL